MSNCCTFFGHRNTDPAIIPALRREIERHIDTFYVGVNGDFDAMVSAVLGEMKQRYPQFPCTWCWPTCPARPIGNPIIAIQPSTLKDWSLCRAAPFSKVNLSLNRKLPRHAVGHGVGHF